MRQLLIITFLFSSIISSGQMKSAFTTLPDEEGAIVYQGYCSWADLLGIPEFKALNSGQEHFKDEVSLLFLKEHLPEYKIMIFLGTWCSDSQDLLPLFYELVRKTGFPENEVVIIALDRHKRAKDHIEEQYSITNVPTFILMKDGKEAGRITEQVEVNMGQDLIALIKADQQH